MTQREHDPQHRRGPGHVEHPHDRDRYASREYEDMASLTNRQWGPDRTDEQRSFGQRGLGGYGNFTERDRQSSGRPGPGRSFGDNRGNYQQGQGGYAEDQGRHAQSGHGRGGSESAQHRATSRGPDRETTGRETTSQRGRGPRNYLRSDSRIADDLIDRLTDDDQIDASEILVMVENGVVTLTGEVEARWMKHRAEDIASEVSGVRDINNRLVVDPGVSAFGPLGSAVRSGRDQRGSGFSSSARISDPASEPSTRSGRSGPES